VQIDSPGTARFLDVYRVDAPELGRSLDHVYERQVVPSGLLSFQFSPYRCEVADERNQDSVI